MDIKRKIIYSLFIMLIFSNFFLAGEPRGFVLSKRLQQGHQNPFQDRYISQVEQRFCPFSYRPIPHVCGLVLLYRIQIPIQDIKSR